MPVDRYHRQTLLPEVGADGQAKLAGATAVVIGVGALGTVISDALARAGVGRLVLVDRDLVELTNLQRQTLFAESDVGEPKAVAAAARLRQVNSQIAIEAIPTDVDATNVAELVAGADVVLDGLDNAETRYLLNDVCVRDDLPWVYGAAVGTSGRAMAILPQETACLRCVFPEPPRPGELETCDTSGVLAMAAGIAANWQAAMGLGVLLGATSVPLLHAFDVWQGVSRPVRTQKDPDCPCCARREFPFLDRPASATTSLCGRDAIQVKQLGRLDLSAAAARFATLGRVKATPFLVRVVPEDRPELRLTAFADGRVIVQGTTDGSAARSIVARLLGS